VRRWQARLGLAARGLGQVLASSGAPVLEQVATRLGLSANRRQLVQGLALPLGAVAALLHRLVPGVRLL
jgi:hypothetical protein